MLPNYAYLKIVVKLKFFTALLDNRMKNRRRDKKLNDDK